MRTTLPITPTRRKLFKFKRRANLPPLPAPSAESASYSGDETDQTADSDTDLDTTADDTATEALDPDEIEELSDVECDDDDIDAGETEENNHDGMYDEIAAFDISYKGKDLEACDEHYVKPKMLDYVGFYFCNVGLVMGQIVEVSKSKKVKKPYTVEFTDDEVSIWAMAEEKWNEGMWWIIKSKIDLVAPSRRD